MTIKSTVLTMTFCVQLVSCTSSISNKIYGTWNMEQVYNNSDNVTAELNPKQDRWITFSKDGSFKSGGTPYGKNGGKWIYHPSDKLLFLDSDEGEGDDSYWILQVGKKEMNWAGARSSFTERFKISFTKK